MKLKMALVAVVLLVVGLNMRGMARLRRGADDYMTKITAVTPDNAMPFPRPFPRFESFLSRGWRAMH
ncbi:hypothetical protein [Mesorhizobium sp. URHB0026]